jgi:hypothetical protein
MYVKNNNPENKCMLKIIILKIYVMMYVKNNKPW